MKKLINSWIKSYSVLPLIFTLVFDCVVYWGARLIAGNWKHYNMETNFDKNFPLIEWMVVIYFLCYIFWGVNYIWGASFSKQECYRFLMADWIGKIICFAFYILLPTTNVRPEINGSGIWDVAMRYLYQSDAADNLFPSIHCFVSWVAYIGVRGRKDVPKWYRVFSLFFAFAVFISTMATKQHVLYDVLSGWALAELTYWMSGRIMTHMKEAGFRWSWRSEYLPNLRYVGRKKKI